MPSGAGGEATKALKSTTGQKFYVSRQKRAEYNDSNRITMTRKQGEQHIENQQQRNQQQGKRWYNRLFNRGKASYTEEEEEFMEMVRGRKSGKSLYKLKF